MKRVADKIRRNQKVAGLVAIMLIASTGLFAQQSASKWKLFKSSKVEAEVVYTEPSSVAIVSYNNYLRTLDFVIESKVELEDWMTDATSWESDLADADAVSEEELVVEEWMLNFELPSEVNDYNLALEDWMNSTECWK